MTDFSLSPEQKMLREMTRKFAETELMPGVIDRDQHSIFPKKQLKKMGELGLMGVMVPEKWGGAGFNT